MTPFSRYSEQQQRDLQEFGESPSNFAPPLSRLVVTELGDYLVVSFNSATMTFLLSG